jgi:hypothetical protein
MEYNPECVVGSVALYDEVGGEVRELEHWRCC